eukprot:SAG11_NODE_10134_length_852_cov_1.731740_2_plen_126_part_01
MVANGIEATWRIVDVHPADAAKQQHELAGDLQVDDSTSSAARRRRQQRRTERALEATLLRVKGVADVRIITRRKAQPRANPRATWRKRRDPTRAHLLCDRRDAPIALHVVEEDVPRRLVGDVASAS